MNKRHRYPIFSVANKDSVSLLPEKAFYKSWGCQLSYAEEDFNIDFETHCRSSSIKFQFVGFSLWDVDGYLFINLCF